MKKTVSLLLLLTLLFVSIIPSFATTNDSQVSYSMEPSILTNKVLTQAETSQIESEINILKNCRVDTSAIKKVDVTEKGNEYILNYKNVDEKVSINSSNDEDVTIIASDGKKNNIISFKKDGSIILDGNEIQVSQVNQTDMKSMPIYKSVKSLKPYGNLKSSDYDDYLTSGEQNIALGKSLNNLTITALAVVISGFHPYVGITVSLSGVALGVHDVLMNVNPTTEYLGCKYTTYTAGYSNYEYINKFYANRECTGTYKLEKSYEHFIVY